MNHLSAVVAGDVDGDGIHDLVFANPNYSDIGSVSVFPGPLTADTVEHVVVVGDVDPESDGGLGHALGYSLAVVDMNGAYGIPEIAMSYSYADTAETTDGGSVFLFAPSTD